MISMGICLSVKLGLRFIFHSISDFLCSLSCSVCVSCLCCSNPFASEESKACFSSLFCLSKGSSMCCWHFCCTRTLWGWLILQWVWAIRSLVESWLTRSQILIHFHLGETSEVILYSSFLYQSLAWTKSSRFWEHPTEKPESFWLHYPDQL